MESKGMTAVLEAKGLVVDVSELLRRPGMARPFQATAEVAGLAVDLASVAGGAVELDLTLHSVMEGILVTGSVSGTLDLECRRCLAESEGPIRVEIDEVFARDAQIEDAYRIREGHIDLEPMVRDDVVLALPLNPLCRENCKGLCPECGRNLNESDCGHRPERIDVRWEPLCRLKEEMGE